MGLDVRTPVITKNAGWSTQSYSLCLAFSNAFGVFLLPFMGKFIQLIKSATHFLHALGQAAYSGASHPLIPGEVIHPFRTKPSTDSGAKHPAIPTGKHPL